MTGLIDIQKLFDIPDAATEDREAGLERVVAMQTPGGMAAYLAPQRQRNAAAGFGRMLGLDLRSEKDKLRDQLQQVGTPQTEQEHQAYADLLDQLKPGAGVQYQIGRAQEKRAERGMAVDESDAASRETQANASRLQAETTALYEPARVAALTASSNAQLIQAQTNDRDNPRALRAQESANEISRYVAETARMRVELDAENLTTAQLGVVNEAVAASNDAFNKATESMTLANSILAAGDSYTTGGIANIEAAWREWRGTQDNLDALRNSYMRLVNKMTLANLPPGAASDNDIKMARQGFLPVDANPKQIAQFLRGYAKLQAVSAVFNQEQALYASENKGDLSGFRTYWENIKESEDITSRINVLSSHDLSEEDKEITVAGGGAAVFARDVLGEGTASDSALRRALDAETDSEVTRRLNETYNFGGQ